MQLAFFQKLRPAAQVRFALTLGTYLLPRLAQEAEVHLYYLPGEGKGFFVELRYASQREKLTVVRSFEQLALLVDYLALVRLPAESYLD